MIAVWKRTKEGTWNKITQLSTQIEPCQHRSKDDGPDQLMSAPKSALVKSLSVSPYQFN